MFLVDLSEDMRRLEDRERGIDHGINLNKGISVLFPLNLTRIFTVLLISEDLSWFLLLPYMSN